MTRYYNLEANNNHINDRSIMGGGGVKQMSKPMKLGQPIDGRLGKHLENSRMIFLEQLKISCDRKSSRETPNGPNQSESFTEGKGN